MEYCACGTCVECCVRGMFCEWNGVSKMCVCVKCVLWEGCYVYDVVCEMFCVWDMCVKCCVCGMLYVWNFGMLCV